MKNELEEKIAAKVYQKATDLIEIAAREGSFGDNGGMHLKELVDFWLMGLRHEIPARFQKYYDEVIKEEDPEYKEYLRLKAKFQSTR